MSQCSRCATALEDAARFCPTCAQPVPVMIPAPPPPLPAGPPAMAPPAPPPATAGPGRAHRAGMALVLERLVPRAGQAYHGQPVKGFFLLFTSVLVLPWLYSLYDAYAGARRIAVTGGRMGRGGVVWVFLQTWLALNVTLVVL